jgi:hypothetical protein
MKTQSNAIISLAATILLLVSAAGSRVNASSVTAYTGVNCIGQVNGNGCVVQETNSGPIASAQQSSVIQGYAYDSSGHISDVYYGNASATASLADGTLHASASTGYFALNSATAIARAQWEETVFFDLTSIIDPVTIGFAIDIDGTYGQRSASGVGFDFHMFAANSSSLNGSHGLAHRLTAGWYQSDGLLHDASDLGGAPLPYGFSISNLVGVFSSLGPNLFSGSFILDPGAVYSIALYMGLNGAANFDFGNSAHFRFDSPISFTSQSGVFLTAEAPAVPLPAALPMFAAGLGAMGFMGWRRKRKNDRVI